MLYRTNVLALVGGGKNPKFTPNKVIIWDDYQTKVVHEFKFTSSVKNVKLKKDKIVIVCEQRIFVYNNSAPFKNIDTIETYNNPRGVVGINTDSAFTVLGYPDNGKGFIKVKYYEKSSEILIHAYDHEVSNISINSDGTLVATASDQGTLIDIFYVNEGNLVEEFRRGKEKADINYMSFDINSNFLAASSDRGTIHIWSLGSCWEKLKERGVTVKKGQETLPKNNDSVLKGLPKFLTGGFFNSSKSFAQIKLNDEKSICGFGPDNTIIAISCLGKYYLAKLDLKKGGECSISCEEDLNKKK